MSDEIMRETEERNEEQEERKDLFPAFRSGVYRYFRTLLFILT